MFLAFVQGVGGAVQYPKNYLKGAYKLVRERGGICIADEVWIDLLFTTVLCQIIYESKKTVVDWKSQPHPQIL